MASSAARIIELLGGTRAAARHLDKAVSTVDGWKKAGYIPGPQQEHVLAVCRRLGLPVTKASFYAGHGADHSTDADSGATEKIAGPLPATAAPEPVP